MNQTGIEVCAVGGYEHVGGNMTAIRIDDKVIICDMGINLEPYTQFNELEDVTKVKVSELIKIKAVPDPSVIDDWKKKVVAIVTTHAHLDHMGAIPFLSNEYRAPIICTPYTKEVISAIIKDENIRLKNRLVALNPNSKMALGSDLTIEFIHMTHSVPQTVMIAFHTKYGIIVYANDFKFDRTPVLGKEANLDRLRELGQTGNVLLLICESTYAALAAKTPSEAVAKEMLKDVMLTMDSSGKAVVVSTFSSHIARLKSIVELGGQMKRKIVFLGRSLAKYTRAAENLNLVKFSDSVEIVKYSSKVQRKLKQIMKDGKENYLLVVTGHQGEPNSVLTKMVTQKYGFVFGHEDHVIFSCKVIPAEINIRNREHLESQLSALNVRMFKDIHVSGHAAREELRDLIKMLVPKNIIPAHGEPKMREALADLAHQMGYDNEHVFVMQNGERIIVH